MLNYLIRTVLHYYVTVLEGVQGEIRLRLRVGVGDVGAGEVLQGVVQPGDLVAAVQWLKQRCGVVQYRGRGRGPGPGQDVRHALLGQTVECVRDQDRPEQNMNSYRPVKHCNVYMILFLEFRNTFSNGHVERNRPTMHSTGEKHAH